MTTVVVTVPIVKICNKKTYRRVKMHLYLVHSVTAYEQIGNGYVFVRIWFVT